MVFYFVTILNGFLPEKLHFGGSVWSYTDIQLSLTNLEKVLFQIDQTLLYTPKMKRGSKASHHSH